VDISRGSDRTPILVRKVLMHEGKRRGGIYYQNGNPARQVTQGELYRAKINGTYVDVIAGPNQILYDLKVARELGIYTPQFEDIQDPRVRATEADVKAIGFDQNKGNYRYPIK